MAITFHPPQGCIVTVDYSQGFTAPEMVKLRLGVVLHKEKQPFYQAFSAEIEAAARRATGVRVRQHPPDTVGPGLLRLDLLHGGAQCSWKERRDRPIM